jgi:predicted secreted protein
MVAIGALAIWYFAHSAGNSLSTCDVYNTGQTKKDCLSEEAYWRRHPEELEKVVDEDREDRARERRSR